jgi:hypothetical protein
MYSRNEKQNSNTSPNHTGGLFSKIFGRNKKPKVRQNESSNDPNDSISHSHSSPKIYNQNDSDPNESKDNINSTNNIHKRSYHNVFIAGNENPHIKKDYDSLSNEIDVNPLSALKHKKIPSMFDLATNVSLNESRITTNFNNLVINNPQNTSNTQITFTTPNKVMNFQDDQTKRLEPLIASETIISENNSMTMPSLQSPSKISKFDFVNFLK